MRGAGANLSEGASPDSVATPRGWVASRPVEVGVVPIRSRAQIASQAPRMAIVAAGDPAQRVRLADAAGRIGSLGTGGGRLQPRTAQTIGCRLGHLQHYVDELEGSTGGTAAAPSRSGHGGQDRGHAVI